MICLSCVNVIIIGFIVVIVIVSGVVICVQLFQWQHYLQKLYILKIHVYISLIYAHEILGRYDIYFWNGSHLNKIINVALLSIWLSLEPLYLAQLCIYTGATYKEKNYASAIKFLKLWIFKKNYILHFLAHIHAKDTNPHPHLSLFIWWHTAGASGVYSFY